MEPPSRPPADAGSARAPAAKRPVSRRSPPQWSLDVAVRRPSRKQPRPPARVAAPTRLRPVAAPAAAKPRASEVALQLEIQGLSGELQRAVEALLGKVIELPALRIRVKSDDLG
jgi:hypothetical protein